MRKILPLILILSLFLGCRGKTDANSSALQITLTNPSNFPGVDELIQIDVAQLKQRLPDFDFDNFAVFESDNEIPAQALDCDGDGLVDKIGFLLSFQAKEKKVVEISSAQKNEEKKTFPRRAYAGLSHKFGGHFENKKYIGGEFKNVRFARVPQEHTDHSGYFRYEGPGWESDKVGYRFYLDWRNAIDIFGKKTSEIVLPKVGQDNFDSYHEMSDWGMDIFKVGNSLGIGSIGMFVQNQVKMVAETDSVTCAILAEGPIWAHIQTRYLGWKVGDKKFDLVSNLSIAGGGRMTRHNVEISNGAPNLCTGFAKHEDCELLKPVENNENGWQYLGYWGKQSLAGDNLGIAIFYWQKDLLELTEDDVNHIVILQPRNGKVDYYFLAAWEQEPGGIKTLEEFREHLEDLRVRLDNPILVEISE